MTSRKELEEPTWEVNPCKSKWYSHQCARGEGHKGWHRCGCAKHEVWKPKPKKGRKP
jgi:hypothetical protein